MSTGNTNQANSPAEPADAGPRWDSARLAAAISMHVKSLVVTLFWGIAGFAALAAGYVAFRGIVWAAQELLRAIGV